MRVCCWFLRCAVAMALTSAAAGLAWAEMNEDQFEEVSAAAGISYVGPSWGSAWGDFDGDGLPDLWLVNHWNNPSLYLNQGNGSFVDVVPQVFPPDLLLDFDAHGAAWADFDNDGDHDLYQLADGGLEPKPAFLFVNNDGQMEDMAAAFGLDYLHGRGRMPLWLDFDRDGWLDALLLTHRRSGTYDWPLALFRQDPTGFTDITDAVGLERNEIKTTNFAQLADLSGDGMVELLIQMGGYPDKVYDTTVQPFDEISSAVGMIRISTVADAAVVDLDGDLDSDIFAVRGEEARGFVQVDENTVEAHFSVSDGTERGIAFETRGLVTIDIYPRWTWPVNEVFIGAGGRHPTDLTFTLSPIDTTVWGIADHVPGEDPGLYIGFDPETEVWRILRAEKLTNLVVESTTPISELAAIGWEPEDPPLTDYLLVNLGDEFADRTASAGFLVPSSGRNVVAADFDNDMDQDLYIVSTGPVQNWPNILYENQGDGHFTVVPDAGGAAGNSLGRGDAVSVADYDGDGFLDLLVTNGASKAPFDEDGPTWLFRNLGNDNHWIEIDLEGVLSNRDGIGARLLVSAGGTVQLREQDGGIHYRGQCHQRVHFGLGGHDEVDELRVYWPSGIVQVIQDIPADQIVRVVEPPATDALEADGVPPSLRLIGCYPNPFNPATIVAFSLATSQPVDLNVHDAAGRLVRRLIAGEIQPAGLNEVVWDGRDDAGGRAPSGVYFLRLTAGSRTEMGKVVLVK